jgi:hypothetical protein
MRAIMLIGVKTMPAGVENFVNSRSCHTDVYYIFYYLLIVFDSFLNVIILEPCDIAAAVEG